MIVTLSKCTLNSLLKNHFCIRMKRKVDGQLRTETRKLRAAFNDMDMVRSPAQSVDALIRGMTDSPAEKMDENFADDVRLEIWFLCSQGLS